MKRAKKVIALVLCVILLMAATVVGTLAYLTSKAEVKNTFTAGNVTITMNETDVNEYGVKDGESRVTANTYNLVPGHKYTKDPLITVGANSEDCFVYVQIENGISQYLIKNNLENQLIENGWTKLTDDGKVWYQTHAKQDTAKKLKVFETFTVKTDADSVTGWDSINTTDNVITVTAYAIQTDTFGDAADAWTALMNQLKPNPNPNPNP